MSFNSGFEKKAFVGQIASAAIKTIAPKLAPIIAKPLGAVAMNVGLRAAGSVAKNAFSQGNKSVGLMG